MDLIFCNLKKAQKTWISCFASFKKLKKHGFRFLKALKNSKNMEINSFFTNLKNSRYLFDAGFLRTIHTQRRGLYSSCSKFSVGFELYLYHSAFSCLFFSCVQENTEVFFLDCDNQHLQD